MVNPETSHMDIERGEAYYCPVCGYSKLFISFEYCPMCGVQADWSDVIDTISVLDDEED